MTSRSLSRPSRVGDRRIRRFDPTERMVHWTTALFVLCLVATGAVLYIPSLGVVVGRRLIVEDVHVYVGVAVFVPLLIGALGRWGKSLRGDILQMNRLNSEEIAWLRSLGRQGRAAIGKFNPGQKLNTSAIGGMLTVLFLTGVVLRWGNFLPVGLRTGATFIHDVFALAFVVLVAGHIGFALTHPAALRAMVAGWVSEPWVRRHAPSWNTEARGAPGKQSTPPGSNAAHEPVGALSSSANQPNKEDHQP